MPRCSSSSAGVRRTERVPPGPGDEDRLERQAHPVPDSVALRPATDRDVVECDVEVRGKDGGEEEDDAPRRHPPGRRDQYPHAERDLGQAGEVDEPEVPWQVGWHHRQVEAGVDEVIHAVRDVEDPHHPEEHAPARAHVNPPRTCWLRSPTRSTCTNRSVNRHVPRIRTKRSS